MSTFQHLSRHAAALLQTQALTPITSGLLLEEQQTSFKTRMDQSPVPVPQQMIAATPSLSYERHKYSELDVVPPEQYSGADHSSPPVLFGQGHATVARQEADPFRSPTRDVAEVKEWLRFFGKQRGWEMELLDTLLSKDLAAVLAAHDSPASDGRGQSQAFTNPLGLEDFVRQIAGTTDAQQAHREVPHGEQVVNEVMQVCSL
jgi:hypothetical protein